MEKDNRQIAYQRLISLASKQGFVTFDDIMDTADDYSLPIQDFDWLSNSITSNGVLVYSEIPTKMAQTDEDEVDDFAQSDYEAVYTRIVELNPSLKDFVDAVGKIVPPQRYEINQLKYQVVEGNAYARNRMIEMHLRVALRLALQRSETFDMEIEDAIGYACIGLTMAVDKYDPDTSGAFGSYASLWILQNISREQGTLRPHIYYPVHQKENYFSLYPFLKRMGCIGCEDLANCIKAKQLVINKLECSELTAMQTIEQMIPDWSLEAFKDENFDDIETGLISFSEMEDSLRSPDELVFESSLKKDVEEVISTLSEREQMVIKMRFGFNGPEQSLEQIGNILKITRERVRQIEAKALRKLAHPSRSKRLRDYI